MTETIDTANLRALAENIIAADGPIWWIEQDFRAVKEVLDATIDDARFVAAANPATILALLDRLAAAEARNATLTREAHENKYRAREFERQAERYRELRRGQDWSVIDGIGDTLRAEALDEAIDAAIQARAAAMKEKTP